MDNFTHISGISHEEIEEFLGDAFEVDEEAEHARLLEELNKIVAPTDDDDAEVVSVGGPTGPIGPVLISNSQVIALENPAVIQSVVAPTAARPTTSLPDGYASFPDGIYEMPSDDSAEPVFICSPLQVESKFADQEGRGFGRLISVKSTLGDWKEIPVLNADLQRRPGDVIANLIDLGLDLSHDKRAKDRLLTFLKLSKPDTHLQSVKQMGWADDGYSAFVMGTTLIGRDDVLPLAPPTGIGTGLAVLADTDGWKREVGAKCRDNPLMILATSLAFSGPLLAPLGLAGGGLHFRGASSSGKTTLLHLAASVWGGKRLITQWRATTNGLEAIAATLNDMLLPLDEIAEIQARDLHNAIYMLANGTGKARMTKNSVLADQARWRLALISSGEISVHDKLKEARLDAMAGHEVRLIDVEADCRTYGVFDDLHGATSGAAFADAVQNSARDFHGAVGRDFVENLIQSGCTGQPQRLESIAHDYATKWVAKLPSAADGQILRVAKRFAVIGLAGDLATRFGLTGWQKQEATTSAAQAFADWYDRRYGSRREAVEVFVKPLQKFLAANLDSMPVIGSAHPPVDALGWRDVSRVYLPAQTWVRIFPGAEGTAAAKALIGMEMLQSGEEGRLTRKAPRAIPGPRTRLYTVNVDRVTAFRPE